MNSQQNKHLIETLNQAKVALEGDVAAWKEVGTYLPGTVSLIARIQYEIDLITINAYEQQSLNMIEDLFKK